MVHSTYPRSLEHLTAKSPQNYYFTTLSVGPVWGLNSQLDHNQQMSIILYLVLAIMCWYI